MSEACLLLRKLNTFLPRQLKPIPVPSYNVPVLRTWLPPPAACCGGGAFLVSLSLVLLVRLMGEVCP